MEKSMDSEAKAPARRRTKRPTEGGHAPDARVESILAAACRAIIRLGYESTRIADIAREAGTSTGTVHYYFQTKDDVLLAALRWANEQPYRRLEQAFERDGSARGRLAALLEFSVPYAGRPHEEYVLLIELWNRILHRPELVPEAERSAARWRSYFADVVGSGTGSGAFNPVTEPNEVVERLIALVDGLALKAVLGYRWSSPERVREVVFGFAAEQLGVPYDELERLGRESDLAGAAEHA